MYHKIIIIAKIKVFLKYFKICKLLQFKFQVKIFFLYYQSVKTVDNQDMKYFFIFLSFLWCSFLFAVDLSILPEDIRLKKVENGYELFVRKKSGMNSILLTETTKDPSLREDNYAYRALTWNKINGNEKRILNGEFLNSPSAQYALIDSTSEKDEALGECFRIFIPQELYFGYPWTRNGKVVITRGTFINIRAFDKSYGDYTGNFQDNPYMFDFEKRETVLTDKYDHAAVSAFKEIASQNKGLIRYSQGPASLIDDIIDSLLAVNPKNDVDVVFAIDTTGSMKDDIEKLRRELVPRLIQELDVFKHIRIGLLLYRDYGDNYNYKNLPVKPFPFTEDLSVFLKNLNDFTIVGREGGDVPEAVYEALYGAMEFYQWKPSAVKKVILIGDAPPHSRPRGRVVIVDQKKVEKMAFEKNISIDCIITPDDKTD